MLGIKTKIKKIFRYYFPNDTLYKVRLDPSGITCNHKCIMCWQQQLSKQQRKNITTNYQKNKLLFKDYQKLIDSFPKSVNSVELVGGGEPLLFGDIEKLIKLIKEKKYLGSLITNGVFLSKPVRKALLTSKWEFIRISFHAASQETYQEIHAKDNFEIVVKNIKSFLSERDEKTSSIGLLFVIQKKNFHELEKFVKLAKKIGVDEIEFDYLIPDSKKELFLNKNELNKVIVDLGRLNSSLKNNINTVQKMFINHAWDTNKDRKRDYFDNATCHLHHLEINQAGKTTPCCLLWGSEINKDDNVKNTDIKDIWKLYKPLRKKLRQGKFPQHCIDNCYYDLKK